MGSVYLFPQILDMAFCARGCNGNATTAFKWYRDKTVIGECQFVVLSFLLTTGLKRRIRGKTAYHQYISTRSFAALTGTVSPMLLYTVRCKISRCFPITLSLCMSCTSQDVHSVSASCDSRCKTLRLRTVRLHDWDHQHSQWAYVASWKPLSHLFDLIIIGDSFPSACGIEF
jgi:hypothetical protein